MSVRAGNEPTPGNLAKIYCCNTFYSRSPIIRLSILRTIKDNQLSRHTPVNSFVTDIFQKRVDRETYQGNSSYQYHNILQCA